MAKRPPTRRNNCLSRSHQKSADAYVGTAIALTNMGDCEYAKEAIQQARALNAQLSSAVVHLGYLYTDDHLGHSDPEADRRLFKQATQLRDPFAGIALLNLQTPVHSHLSLPAERAAQECHPGSRSFFYGRAIQTIFHIQPETWPNRERRVKEN